MGIAYSLSRPRLYVEIDVVAELNMRTYLTRDHKIVLGQPKL
jgi:hypothetical protein